MRVAIKIKRNKMKEILVNKLIITDNASFKKIQIVQVIIKKEQRMIIDI